MNPYRVAVFLQRLCFPLLLAWLFAASAGAATPMVSAGYRHVMALKSDGSLWAWGWNASGQLGDGSTTDRTTPVKVGEGFVYVSAGMAYSFVGDSNIYGGHTVAIKADGSLWAWGDNKYGQLGDGSTSSRSSPVKIGEGYVAAAAGGAHTLALKADGTLWSWGGNWYGQLGDGTTADRHSPAQIYSGFTQIAAGWAYSAALGSDGSLWTWGANGGQLGDGTTADRHSPVNIGTGYAQVAARDAHTVALKNDGSLWAWGRNAYGQVGDGSTTDRSSPVQIGTGYVQVTVGSLQSQALKADGSRWVWGKSHTTDAIRSIPMSAENDDGYAQVGIGNLFSVYLRDDGTVWAAGTNSHGQLGDGMANQTTSAVVDLKLTADETSPATAPRIAGSTGCLLYTSQPEGESSYYIKPDGSLWAWGRNIIGELGIGGTARSVPLPALVDYDFVQVTAARCHVLAIKSDGSLWGWGDNMYGQLGDGTTSQRKTPTYIGDNFAQVSTSKTHTVAVKRDGTLLTWGHNFSYQLGDGTTTQRNSPVLIGSGYQRAKALDGFTLAVKRTGSLWGMGTGNVFGTPDRKTPTLLGNGFGLADTDFANRSEYLRKNDGYWWSVRDRISYAGKPTTVQIASGESHSLILLNDGSLYGKGTSNTYGQIGSGTTAASSAYLAIGSGFADIVAGGYHNLALKTDGSLWAWGMNLTGEIGDDTTTQRNSPVQVFAADVALVGLSVSGPETVEAGGTAEFTANATFSDNNSLKVKAEWSVTGSGASIAPASLFNSTGAAVLSAGEAPVGSTLQVTASYTYLGVTRTASANVKVKEASAVARAACLFAWAESHYADVLAPAGATTQSLAPYTYRHYSGSQAYLGISSTDDHLYYLGPLSGNAILDLGSTATWLGKAGCQ